MAAPLSSRYPRPLKATRAYLADSPGLAPLPRRMEDSYGRPLCGSLSPPRLACVCDHSSKTSLGDLGVGLLWSSAADGPLEDSLPRKDGARQFQERIGARVEVDCWKCSQDLRRCYSAGSLRVVTGVASDWRCDVKELLPGDSIDEGQFSHKRSKSCSSADRLKRCGGASMIKSPKFRGSVVGPAHTRISVEGLNQEVSSALEGNPTHLFQTTPTDGRAAPVRDLLGGVNRAGLTPPTLSISTAQITQNATPSSSSSSPHPLPSSPSSSTLLSDFHHQGTSTSSLESPAHSTHLPPSPKPSFAHDPPDGAERCQIKMDAYVHSEEPVLQGPDKSKGTIIFKGSVFSPLVV